MKKSFANFQLSYGSRNVNILEIFKRNTHINEMKSEVRTQ